MHISSSNISCGVKQLYSLGNYGTFKTKLKGAIAATSSWIEAHEAFIPAFYVFSDRTSYRTGDRLAANIVKHKLGTVIETERRKNPNTQGFIKVWVWVVDIPALRAFLKEK